MEDCTKYSSKYCSINSYIVGKSGYYQYLDINILRKWEFDINLELKEEKIWKRM